MSVEELEYFSRKETYLERAEKLLYDHFYAHVRQGEYEQARQVVTLLSALCII